MLYWVFVAVFVVGVAVSYTVGVRGRKPWGSIAVVVCVVGLVATTFVRLTGIGSGGVGRSPAGVAPAIEADVERVKALAEAVSSQVPAGSKVVVVVGSWGRGQNQAEREQALAGAVKEILSGGGEVIVMQPDLTRTGSGVYTEQTADAAVLLFVHNFDPQGWERFAQMPLMAACFGGPGARESAQRAIDEGGLNVAVLDDGTVLP